MRFADGGHGGEVVDGDDPARRRRQVEDLVARVAGGLRARGVRRGDAVAWQVPNSLAAAVLTRACWRIGAVAAPVLHSFGRADVERALAQIDPAWSSSWPPTPSRIPSPWTRRWAARRCRPDRAATRPSDVALVLFTSGSTGTPKAVLHTHRGLSWKATLMARCTGSAPATPC